MVVVDATGQQDYIRVPLDGTGKRSGTIKILAVEYGSGTIVFNIGDIVTGASSTTFGTVVHVQGTISTGTIYVVINEDSSVTNFTVSENLQVSAVTRAIVTSEAEIHFQANVIVGANNPLNAQNVSSLGSAQIRYAEGEQLIDALGNTKISNLYLMDQILFIYNTNSTRFFDNVSGSGAAITHLSESASVALDIGTTIGEICQRTTHVYYPYTPGFGALTEMAVLSGDSGKDGVVRRWGRYDNNDGLFFELSGSEFNVVQRSSTTGTPIETRISQSGFNIDSVDGTGASRHTYDPSKFNLYWLDYAWLGAGKVRFGLYTGTGERVTMHEFRNAGSDIVPYMAKGSLPFRIEIKNNGTTASPSRLSTTCVSLKTDGYDFQPDAKVGNTLSIQNDKAIAGDANTCTQLISGGIQYVSVYTKI